jgi:hypothetical protein
MQSSTDSVKRQEQNTQVHKDTCLNAQAFQNVLFHAY